MSYIKYHKLTVKAETDHDFVLNIDTENIKHDYSLSRTEDEIKFVFEIHEGELNVEIQKILYQIKFNSKSKGYLMNEFNDKLQNYLKILDTKVVGCYELTNGGNHSVSVEIEEIQIYKSYNYNGRN